MPRPWHATSTLQASALLHAALGTGAVLAPQHWPLLLTALIADHGLLAWGGLWPRSTLLGPNLTRLPAAAIARNEIALTFDDGPNPEVTPRVLDLLDVAGAKATFFCIGQQARQHPALVREIVARGHTVENHTEHHPNHFSVLGPRAMAREVAAAQDTLTELSSRTPRFFRAVAGLRNVFLEPILARHDLTLATWSHRAFDTARNQPQPALQRLEHHRDAGDIILLHDGHPAITANGQPMVLEILPILLEQLSHAGLKPVTLEQACA